MNTKEKCGELEQSVDILWKDLEARQGEVFYTAKKLPFRYSIRGGEMFVDRRSRSVTKATFSRALQKLSEEPEKVTGPKSLNVFGAPYVWAILVTLGIVKGKAVADREAEGQCDGQYVLKFEAEGTEQNDNGTGDQ